MFDVLNFYFKTQFSSVSCLIDFSPYFDFFFYFRSFKNTAKQLNIQFSVFIFHLFGFFRICSISLAFFYFIFLSYLSAFSFLPLFYCLAVFLKKRK